MLGAQGSPKPVMPGLRKPLSVCPLKVSTEQDTADLEAAGTVEGPEEAELTRVSPSRHNPPNKAPGQEVPVTSTCAAFLEGKGADSGGRPPPRPPPRHFPAHEFGLHHKQGVFSSSITHNVSAPHAWERITLPTTRPAHGNEALTRGTGIKDSAGREARWKQHRAGDHPPGQGPRIPGAS